MKTHSKTAALILLCAALTLSACDSSGSNDPGNPAIHYTVTFDSQGGSAVSAQTVEENSYATEPASPSRAEHIFGGWYRDAACTDPWAFDSDPVTSDLILYAKWTYVPVVYTVTFDSQGGSAVSAQTVAENAYAAEPAAPSREGHIFGGWYREAACTNAWIFASDPVASDIVLYAKWTAVYTVTFDSRGGDSVDAQQVVENSHASEPAAPSRPYYTFSGWYSDASCLNAWTFADDAVTADMTLYAKWTHNEWADLNVNPVRYDDADGSLDAAGDIFDLQVTAAGDVYVAGEFEQFSGQTIRSVAKLSGSTWSQVGTGLAPNSIVHSICVASSSDIYIGGMFGYNSVPLQTESGGPKAFAKLASGTWDNVTHLSADSTDFYIDASNTAYVSDIICNAAGKLYVVGSFIYAGGQASGNVWNSFATWDGTAWAGFSAAGFQKDSDPGRVNEIFFDEAGTGICVAGAGGFNKVDGSAWSSGNWAYCNGTSWSAPSYDDGYNHPVRFRTDGSCYKKAGVADTGFSCTAKVKNTEDSLYYGEDGYSGMAGSSMVFAPDGTPYIYGAFTTVKWTTYVNMTGTDHVISANGIAMWNGSEWVAYGNLPAATVKQVSRLFFAPSGDMWVTTRNDATQYAFGPNYGTSLYRMKK